MCVLLRRTLRPRIHDTRGVVPESGCYDRRPIHALQRHIMTTFFRALARWPAYVAAGPFLFFSGQTGFRREGLAPCDSYDDVRSAGPGANGGYTWVNRMEAPVG